jgi:hypothetical protein
MSGVLVALEVLSGALRLVSWFGVRACGAGVPFFNVEPTCVAIVPIWKMLDCIGIWCTIGLLAIISAHLVVWGWDVAVRVVCPRIIVGWWCVASSSSLISPSSSCISSRAASIVARLIGGLHVLRGRDVCRD